ncbi:hypothetical protein HU200_015878 [Digitaria exilis]|uniref:Uncharacterized protein n=1 Tax=Digitaria exilis TaxID=1010633 RepID=A0A835F8W0_9POAL|nr:hypothetical protein HU200_015878 [Digitaria exilis]
MASTALPSCSGLSRAGRAHQPVRRSLVFPRKPTCRRRRAGSARAAQDAPPVVRAAVGAVTELLRALSPNKKQPRGSVQREEELDPPPCGSVEDVLAVLEDDYRRAYFLTGTELSMLVLNLIKTTELMLNHMTWIFKEICHFAIAGSSDARKMMAYSSSIAGDFTPGIYTEDCLFEDPTIKFRGRSRYSQNLDLLVPFFDSPSLELESIEKGLRVEMKFVKATWKLRTYLRLPWRPLIAIRGNTTYDLNEDYKVVRHSESWDVSALEAIGQLFVSAPEQREQERR